MQTIKHISIPQPCSQNWNDMTDTTGGRHCATCAKTVVDFTAMTDKQVIDYLATSAKTCGRITEAQLAGINRGLIDKKHSIFNWRAFSIAASLFFAFPVTGVYAQHKIGKVKIAHHPQMAKKIVFKTISGVVRDSTDNSPLPRVVITVKGMNINTVSNLDGSYTLNVPDHTDKIVVTYTGYTARDITLPSENNCLDISLTECNQTKVIGYGVTRRTEILGAVAIITVKKAPFYKRWYHRFIKNHIKKVLR